MKNDMRNLGSLALIIFGFGLTFVGLVLTAAEVRTTPATVTLTPAACELAAIQCKVHVVDFTKGERVSLILENGKTVSVLNKDALLIEEDPRSQNRMPSPTAMSFLLGGLGMTFFGMWMVVVKLGREKSQNATARKG